MRALLLVSAFVLSGCAGSVVGDAISGPQKLAQDDDAYCRSIGASGADYTNCRLFMTQRRDEKHRQALSSFKPDITVPGPAPRRSVTCTTTGPDWGRTTTCD